MRTPLLALLLAAAACSPKSSAWVDLPPAADTTGARLTITGTVHFTNVEGGVYSIRAEDGTNYDPVNLPEAFRKDGLAVEADARKQEAMVGINQVGPIVALIRIRQR